MSDQLLEIVCELGPASTEVEHSLRKIFVHKGTAVRISPRTSLFRRDLSNFALLDKLHQSRNLTGSEKAVATSISVRKKERTFKNWPDDVMYLGSGCILSYYPTMQPYNYYYKQF